MSKPSEDEENKKIAQFSIEIWMTLCEVELDSRKNGNCPNLIKNFNWNDLATMFFNGLMDTELN